jgi:uncharacterized protein YkwD
MRSLRYILLPPAVVACLALAGPASAATGSSWMRTTVAHAGKDSVKANAACNHADTRPGGASAPTLAKSAVCLLNKQRARRGLRKLRLNARLSKAARQHTVDMVRRNYFGHVSRSGSDVVDRLARTGYMRGARSWTVGENLAWGTHSSSAPRAITSMWMNSPGHRANILSPSFREVGIGLALGAPEAGDGPAATYATEFGAKR